jgi:hypothetical protein
MEVILDLDTNITLHNEIKLKDKKIQLLKDTYLKKHKRIDYPEKNVIYILTTEDNKKNRNYIIGKAINLNNEDTLNVIETMVLNKLKEYKEKANRDRFILPLEYDISFFTNIIDNSINFFL